MNHREDGWERQPGFDKPLGPGETIPNPETEEFADEPETFTMLRHVEYIGRIHHMAFRTILQGNGLPPAQVGAMKFILRTPGMSQRELADALHIQRATATVMLQKMEKAGYIDRRPDTEDQRVSRIYPTQMAMVQDAENNKAVESYFEACFRDFQPEDFEALDRCLKKLDANIRTVLDERPEPVIKE